MWLTVLKLASTLLIALILSSYTHSQKAPGSCTIRKRTQSMSSTTIVHSSRSRNYMVNRWALASRSALISFLRRSKTRSLHPIVTLLTLLSNSWTTQAWPGIWDVAKPPSALGNTYRALRRYTEMIKLIPPILARGARRLSVSAVRPSTKSLVPQSLIINHMTERCQDLATISPSQPSLNPVLLIRCVHRPEKSVSYLKYHRFISFFLSYFVILL